MIEFEEMWGSMDAAPGIFSVKFGSDKVNNTPHQFLTNGITVDSYFSPSDNTTNAISQAIRSADNDVQFALLTFTNNELGSAIVDRQSAGINVRGIIDNINDQGGEFDFLSNNGVAVTPDNVSKQTHHKYCIVDADGIDPLVVTGSHNWSGSAETRNDENTLIFHDADIANIYIQEFEARYCEALGLNNCLSSAEEILKNDFSFDAYPNPAVDMMNIQLDDSSLSDLQIRVYDMQGRAIFYELKAKGQNNLMYELNTSGFQSGNYILQLISDKKSAAKMISISK